MGGVLALAAAVLWSGEKSVVLESRFTIFFSDFMKPPPLGLIACPESLTGALPCCADASNSTFDELSNGTTPCLTSELSRLVVGLPALNDGGRSGFDGFVISLSGLSELAWSFELPFEAALGGLGGGGRSGGADLLAFLFSGLSVTRGAASVSSFASSEEDGSCCLFAGTGAVFDDGRGEFSTAAGLSLRGGGVVGLVMGVLFSVIVVASLIVGGG